MSNGQALEGLLTTARRTAQRRNQRASTAHCVLAMLQSDPDVATVLSSSGVREAAFVQALRFDDDENPQLLERATERAERLAKITTSAYVRPMHLLAAIAAEPRSAGYRALERAGVDIATVQDELRKKIEPSLPARAEAPRVKVVALEPRHRSHQLALPVESRTEAKVLEKGDGEDGLAPKRLRPLPPRNRRLHRPERPAAEGANAAASPVARADASPGVGTAVGTGVSTAPRTVPNVSAAGRAASESASGDVPLVPTSLVEETFTLERERFPLLSTLGRNLTELARDGKLDPVIGRDAEIERVVEVLARRRANHAILVGPPGVGKTAIVEGLARTVALSEEGAPGLGRPIVIELTAGALVSGTGVRGAMADKLKKIREEVARAEGRVILFLDEIHSIIGETGGPDDLGSELKGALSRGEMRCIGATTEAEYRKHFERDPAMARRFSVVTVAPPSADTTLRMLEGLLPEYETHHGVRYEPAALRAAVELSVRFLPERHLPDKAIAVLDLAGAKARRARRALVEADLVAQVIADQAHVPLDRLMARDQERLLGLEAMFRDRVVGQEEPLARIAQALRRSAAGFHGKRPLGTFLLLGPTGVGKTETAKAIAECLFASAAYTRFDMSELSESHAVARLFGAPPGYVGHDAGGQLTEAVRQRPYQLVLLDEIEKAHPEVLLALLPLLDEGRLTDGRGRTIDFTHTVIVMTSNLGVAETMKVERAPRIGFSSDTGSEPRRQAELGERALAAARRAMPPELWNRIDETLFFAPLGRDDVREIARRMIEKTSASLHTERGITLRVGAGALDALADAGGFDAALGARPMRRTVGRLVEAPLAEAILRGRFQEGDVVELVARGAELALERAGTSSAAAHVDTAPRLC